jgi:hypothetical protein
MKKKNNKGCLGNVVDSILSDPIKKKKPTEELPSSVDSLNRSLEQQPAKKVRGSKKKDL